jgi:hypothetical protein
MAAGEMNIDADTRGDGQGRQLCGVSGGTVMFFRFLEGCCC